MSESTTQIMSKLTSALGGASPQSALKALVLTGARTYLDALIGAADGGAPPAFDAHVHAHAHEPAAAGAKKPCCDNCAEGKDCAGNPLPVPPGAVHAHAHGHEHPAPSVGTVNAHAPIVDAHFDHPAPPPPRTPQEASHRVGFAREVLRGTVPIDGYVTIATRDGQVAGLVRRDKAAELGFTGL